MSREVWTQNRGPLSSPLRFNDSTDQYGKNCRDTLFVFVVRVKPNSSTPNFSLGNGFENVVLVYTRVGVEGPGTRGVWNGIWGVRRRSRRRGEGGGGRGPQSPPFEGSSQESLETLCPEPVLTEDRDTPGSTNSM